MQIYSKTLSLNTNEFFPDSISPEESLLFDLETTGLSAENNRIFLIGCASWQGDHWQLMQWFDDTGEDEKNILASFLLYSQGKKVLIHFNGNRFDIPFVTRRLALLDESSALSSLNPLPSMQSVDLYQMVKPYKQILGLPDYRQQTLEALVGRDRTENTTGEQEVISYQAFLNGDSSQLSSVLAHNSADVEGLLHLTRLLLLPRIFESNPSVIRAQADYYRGADGTSREELILTMRIHQMPDGYLANPIALSADGCYVNISDHKAIVKVPMFTGELRYFYANYKDYYYLPVEDQAIHKSIAQFTDPNHREQAKAENCYTRKTSTYLPEWDLFRSPFFKKEYRDRTVWFEFTKEMKMDKQFFSDYAGYVYRHVIDANKTGRKD